MVLLQNKWIEMFPTIVAKAKTVEILTPGMPGNRHGLLQLICNTVEYLISSLPLNRFMQLSGRIYSFCVHRCALISFVIATNLWTEYGQL